MSKIYSQLKQIESFRQKSLGKQGRVTLKGEEAKGEGISGHLGQKRFKVSLSETAIAVILFLLIGLNIRSYAMMKSFLSQDIRTAQKINEMEKKLNAGVLQASANSAGVAQMQGKVDRLNSRIKGQMAKIEDLEKQSDGQNLTIANIKKVKNDLLVRVTKLEENSLSRKTNE